MNRLRRLPDQISSERFLRWRLLGTVDRPTPHLEPHEELEGCGRPHTLDGRRRFVADPCTSEGGRTRRRPRSSRRSSEGEGLAHQRRRPRSQRSTSMSKLLESRLGFYSTTESSINLNENPETQETRSTFQDHAFSASVQSTPDIEKKYVHDVYNVIAPHFSSTRFAKWPKVAGFLNSLRPGSIILDAGCGNGKYLGFNPGCLYIGCDISSSLIDICARRGHEVMVADAVNLPYRANFGDAAISIAVLHHLSTESRRRKAIEELVRAVRKDGLILITVWAVEQEDRSLLKKWTPLCHKYDEEWTRPSSPRVQNLSPPMLGSIPETGEYCHSAEQLKQIHNQSEDAEEESKERHNAFPGSGPLEDSKHSSDGKLETHQEYFVPWHLPYHRAEISGASASALENGLAKKDDKKGAVVYNRYYHVFTEGELERLVSGTENAIIIEQFYDKSNWCIVLKKI